MVRSMTGYGEGRAEAPGVKVTVTLRSLNHRFADLRLRLPSELVAKEGELRRRCLETLRRGRVEVCVNVERTEPGEPSQVVNVAHAGAVLAAAARLRQELGVEGRLDLATVLSLPGVIQVQASEPPLGESGRQAVERALEAALRAVDDERLREGERLRADLLERLARMEECLVALHQRAGEVPALVRRRLLERIPALAEGLAPDAARLAQEVAFMAERADVTEELVRLEGHVSQMRSLLAAPDGQPLGKRLDFLAQEVNRETNTVCGKSADLALSRLALEVKAEIERVREQIQNLE